MLINRTITVNYNTDVQTNTITIIIYPVSLFTPNLKTFYSHHNLAVHSYYCFTV